MIAAENLGWAALAFTIATLFVLNRGGRGPTKRLLGYGFVLFYLAFDLWMMSTALRRFGIVSTHQFRVTAVWLAAGWTLAGIPVALRWRQERHLGARYVDVSTLVREAGRAGPSRTQRAQRTRRTWRYLRWTMEYVFTSLICGDLLLFGKDLGASLTAQSARWGVSPEVARVVVTEGFVLLAGLAYSVVISGAAIAILSRSFEEDWAIGRGWNYALLSGPYLWATLTNGYLYPSLWIDLVAYLLTLYVGWRWTSEPPAGTLTTLRLLRNRRERARLNARIKATGDQRVIAARRGRIVAIDASRLRLARPETLGGSCTLGYSPGALILASDGAAVRLKLTDISAIQFARPRRLQLLAGRSSAPIMTWQDGVKHGALPFAIELAAARKQAHATAAKV
jgi:hypothetical protein